MGPAFNWHFGSTCWCRMGTTGGPGSYKTLSDDKSLRSSSTTKCLKEVIGSALESIQLKMFWNVLTFSFALKLNSFSAAVADWGCVSWGCVSAHKTLRILWTATQRQFSRKSVEITTFLLNRSRLPEGKMSLLSKTWQMTILSHTLSHNERARKWSLAPSGRLPFFQFSQSWTTLSVFARQMWEKKRSYSHHI